MRKIWKFLGILISTAVLVLVLIFAYAGMKPAVPGNYETTVKTGREIEANYLAHGNCEVKYTEQQVMENFKKYEIYYPAELKTSDHAENYVYIESSNPVQPVAPEKEETEMLKRRSESSSLTSSS